MYIHAYVGFVALLYMQGHMHVDVHRCICMYIPIHDCVRVHIHKYVSMYVYVYCHTYMNTYTHTYATWTKGSCIYTSIKAYM